MNDQTRKKLGQRAIVVGAGMGGMMAAQMLSHYFETVLVIDKDTLPEMAESRMGAPQGAHVHALLVQGRRNLEKLFPGFTAELIDRGAVCSRAGEQFTVHDAGGWQPRRDIDLLIMTMSRPMLENTVRDLLRRNPRVMLRPETRIEGWQHDAASVTGVILDGGEAIAADLVIDASGRSSESLAWLEAAGFGPVEETKLEIGAGYASTMFKKPPGWTNNLDSFGISASDPDTRGGFMFSVENNCWAASLTGRFDQQPPGDPDKWMEFAKSLCQPTIYEWASKGERIAPIKVYRAPISRWRRYEKLARPPEGLLPLGDALAHVNPMFGQGMTLASTHVMDLWNILEERAASGAGLTGIAAPYFAKTHIFTQQVWQGLEAIEFSFAATKGERPADIDMRIGFNRGLRMLMVSDPEVHRLMFRVGHLINTADVLRRPDITEKVMKIMRAGAPAA